MDNKDSKEDVSRYATFGWILIFFSLIIIIGLLVLFLTKIETSTSLPIDTQIFGHYGDVIGGVAGTFVALVGVLFLYETLNLQRTQFQKQMESQRVQFEAQQEANKQELQDQRKQLRTQSEDQIFYHLLERQQIRINNFSLHYNDYEYKGYDAFSLLRNQLVNEFNSIYKKQGELVIARFPLRIEDEVLKQILKFKARQAGEEYPLKDFEIEKKELLNLILKADHNVRIDVLTHFIYGNIIGADDDKFGSLLYYIGHKRLHDKTFNHYFFPNGYIEAVKKYEHHLEGYINELQFICERVESSSNKEIYFRYLKSQITRSEKMIIYFYLLSGQADKSFWKFVKGRKFLGNPNNLFSDLRNPTDEQIKDELEFIDRIYMKSESEI